MILFCWIGDFRGFPCSEFSRNVQSSLAVLDEEGDGEGFCALPPPPSFPGG